MELIDRLEDLKINDYNKGLLEDVMADYTEHIENLSKLDLEDLKNYLIMIKSFETQNNQKLSGVNEKIPAFNILKNNTDSIEEMKKLYKRKGNLTREDIINLHSQLMNETGFDNVKRGFRTDNDKFVGAFNEDGTKRIDFMPIEHTEIIANLDSLKQHLQEMKTENPFIKPFIEHGVVAVIQPFDDGNTRLARLLQHGRIWKNTNKLYKTDFESPTIYLSENYSQYRTQYREYITELAKQKNNEMWNSWLEFNLYRVQEQLYSLKNSDREIIKRK